MSHKVTIDEYTKFIQNTWQVFASSYGEGSNKKFEVSFSGLCRVTDKDKIIYLGSNGQEAIYFYNSRK